MPAVHRDILLIGLVLSAGLRTAVCAGADPQPDSAALQTVDGPVFSGRVSALDSERVVLDAGDAGEMTLPTRDVLIVRFAPVRDASDAPPAWVLFPNGDRASLEVLRMEEMASREALYTASSVSTRLASQPELARRANAEQAQSFIAGIATPGPGLLRAYALVVSVAALFVSAYLAA